MAKRKNQKQITTKQDIKDKRNKRKVKKLNGGEVKNKIRKPRKNK